MSKKKFGKNIISKISALCIMLALCVNIMGLGSCGQDSGGKTDNPGAVSPDDPAAAEDTPEETGPVGLPPNLPVNDMGGKEITLGLTNWHNYNPLAIHDIEVEELTGEGINDAAYNRNIFMEQTFNCAINTVAFPGSAEALTRLRNQVKAGDDTLDIVFFRAIGMMPPLTEKLLHEFSDVPHVNLNNPWWNKSSIEAMSIGGRVYSLLGDYSMTVLSCVWLTYFNKDLMGDFGLENPYNHVKENKWTLNKMYEMGKIAAMDLNGDGKMGTIEDRVGFMHINNTATALYNGFGERLVDIDADGLPYISLEKPSAIEKFMHIADILSDHDVFLNAHMRTNDAYIHEAGMFVRGQSLFSLGGVYYAPEMRAMEQNFGLLPYPKYDEKQTEWFNPIHSAAIPLITVPVTNGDLDNMGLFIEAFTYQGHTNVRPQFYDIMLQRKVARDDESEEMLEFIFNNIFFDIGEAYDFAGIYGNFNIMACSNKTNIASWLEKNTVRIEREIDKFIDAMVGE